MVFEFKWFFVYCKYLPFHSIWKTKEWRWRFPPVIDRILISSKFSIWYMTCVHMWLSMCHGAWPAGDEIARVILLYQTSVNWLVSEFYVLPDIEVIRKIKILRFIFSLNNQS